MTLHLDSTCETLLNFMSRRTLSPASQILSCVLNQRSHNVCSLCHEAQTFPCFTSSILHVQRHNLYCLCLRVRADFLQLHKFCPACSEKQFMLFMSWSTNFPASWVLSCMFRETIYALYVMKHRLSCLMSSVLHVQRNNLCSLCHEAQTFLPHEFCPACSEKQFMLFMSWSTDFPASWVLSCMFRDTIYALYVMKHRLSPASRVLSCMFNHRQNLCSLCHAAQTFSCFTSSVYSQTQFMLFMSCSTDFLLLHEFCIFTDTIYALSCLRAQTFSSFTSSVCMFNHRHNLSSLCKGTQTFSCFTTSILHVQRHNLYSLCITADFLLIHKFCPACSQTQFMLIHKFCPACSQTQFMFFMSCSTHFLLLHKFCLHVQSQTQFMLFMSWNTDFLLLHKFESSMFRDTIYVLYVMEHRLSPVSQVQIFHVQRHNLCSLCLRADFLLLHKFYLHVQSQTQFMLFMLWSTDFLLLQEFCLHVQSDKIYATYVMEHRLSPASQVLSCVLNQRQNLCSLCHEAQTFSCFTSSVLHVQSETQFMLFMPYSTHFLLRHKFFPACSITDTTYALYIMEQRLSPVSQVLSCMFKNRHTKREQINACYYLLLDLFSICQPHLFFLFFCVPSYISGLHLNFTWIFSEKYDCKVAHTVVVVGGFLWMWPFFNPTIQVITFHLHG